MQILQDNWDDDDEEEKEETPKTGLKTLMNFSFHFFSHDSGWQTRISWSEEWSD